MITEETIDLRHLPGAQAGEIRALLACSHCIVGEEPAAAAVGVCLLHCGPLGWHGARPMLPPDQACVVLCEGPEAAATLASPQWPVAWVRLAWPADAPALFLAIDHARRLRDAFAPAPEWEAPEGGTTEEAMLARALTRIGIYPFEFDLASGQRRISGHEREFIGRASPTFADVAAQVHPDDRPTVLAAFERSRITGGRYQAEFRFLGPEGQYRWTRADGAVVGRHADSPGRLYGISFDVHEDRQARFEFRRARTQWHQLMAGVGMRSWEWTADSGRRRFVGDGDAAPVDLEAAVHPEDLAQDQALLNQAVQRGERYENELRLSDGAGGWRWMRLIGYPLRDGEGATAGLAGLALDTGERRRLDAEIEQLQAILQQSLETGRIYATQWDLATWTRRVFGPATEILGVSSDRIDDAMALFHPDDLERSRALLARTIETGAPYETEFRIHRPDGQERWLYSVGRGWKDQAGHTATIRGVVMDITERRAAEERLAELNRQLEIALTAAQLNPWSVDLRKEIHHAGPRDVELYGEQIRSRERFRAHVLPEDWPEVDRLRDPDFLRSEQPLSIEFRIRAVDDSQRWISCVARGVCDANGEPLELVGISRDITAARRAQQEVLDALAKLERVQQATGVLLWEWTRSTGARIAAAGGRVLSGATLPQIHPRDRFPAIRKMLASQGTDEALELEIRVRFADGEWRWMSLHGRRVSGGDEPEVYAGVLTDISRSKRAEMELASNLEWRQTAVAAARMNLWRIDLESGQRHGGGQDLHWYGQAPGTIDQALATVHPDDYPGVRAAFEAAQASDGSYEVEYRVAGNDDDVRWLRVRGRSMTSADGRRELIGASLDVTEQRRATAELERAVAMAREASEAKSAFLASVSHELRTPLNAVIGYAGLLSGAGLDVRQQHYLHALRSGAGQLLAVIDDVLDFSRIEAGSLVLERTPFDPLECFEGTLALVAAAAEAKGLCLTLDVGFREWPAFLGDRTRLAQVGLNLLSNAVKFTATGSVSMRLDRVVEDGQDFLVVEVRDTGIGMSEDTLARLFTPFRQGEESTARRFGGSGLGLSISQRLVWQMGGTIEVQSRLGEGSTFRIRLPWAIDASQPGRGLAPMAGLRVGVCVQSSALRSALSRQLAVFGAEVIVVPVDVDPASLPLRERSDVLVAGRRALVRLVAHPAWATSGAGLPLVELVSFTDGAERGPESLAHSMSRAIKPSELHAVLGRALEGCSDAAKPQAQDPAAVPAGPLPGDRPRVLVIEDNEINQMLLQAQLESLGLESDLAGSGEAALAIVSELDYPIIFLDVEMPGMDGIDTARAIRALPRSMACRPWIIAVTAHVFAEMRERVHAAGFDDFIAKPVLIDDLDAALARAHAAPGASGQSIRKAAG